MTDREIVILEMIKELFLMIDTRYDYPESFKTDNPIKNAYKKSFDLTVLLRTELNNSEKEARAILNHETIIAMSNKTVVDALKKDSELKARLKKNKEDAIWNNI